MVASLVGDRSRVALAGAEEGAPGGAAVRRRCGDSRKAVRRTSPALGSNAAVEESLEQWIREAAEAEDAPNLGGGDLIARGRRGDAEERADPTEDIRSGGPVKTCGRARGRSGEELACELEAAPASMQRNAHIRRRRSGRARGNTGGDAEEGAMTAQASYGGVGAAQACRPE